ncbi:hypothetical protein [Streptomyces sp. NPDC088766]|uniref:hypothetical protein n=1 Tax=Streptomyces sp. NPDC088766 TaxID=3365893 RepID=UPI00380B93F3
MHVNLNAVMGAVIVIAFGATALARGRWSGPWWLVLIGAVVTYPFSHILMDRLEDAPGGWLRGVFQVSCGMLMAVLIAPLHHRLRRPDGPPGREPVR